jgi:(1->4)-alpha-D-glucan 1-alpha-D-glucosylmutase
VTATSGGDDGVTARRRVPTGTYRVQLTAEHGFAHLAAMAGHLARLGVSHAYLSPVLGAAPGSQHGYDVVDHSRVDDALGGEDGLRAAADALHAQGMGIILDVVPNHTAMTVPEHLNRVLWSVLRDGAASPYATWLDVDRVADRQLLLPVLGRRIDECLDDREITLDAAGGPDGEPVVRYADHVLPVRPGTEHLPLEELLDAQAYRLAYWRVADEELNYRRFFDIDTLVALRVEDPDVFAGTHEVVLRLLHDGVVDGLRIDHPDGLANPRGYLRRLAVSAGAEDAAPFVVVEKILEPGEELPADWPCAGTTGYDALAAIARLQVDPDGVPLLTAAFAELTGTTSTWPEASYQARCDVLRGPLVAEVDRLARLAHAVCQAELRLRDHSLRGLADALVELLAAMPVYRAYVVPGEPAPPETVVLLDEAAALAAARLPARTAEIMLLRDLALGRRGRSAEKDELCVRFQQTTGPTVAKGDEDTAAYRWFPLVGLADVGSRPDATGGPVADWHAFAQRRQATWPASMSATSTHDTKRSEDVRARLAVLSEVPDEWVLAVQGWRSQVGELAQDGGGPAEWLLWQTLVGAAPLDGDPLDEDRLTAYVVKAAREARVGTSWTRPDAAFEASLVEYARLALVDEAVRSGVAAVVERLHPGFVANSLGQRALQLVLPGVPDVYQGCESVSLRLVDPDNRVPPDVPALSARLDGALSTVPDPWTDLPAAKVRLTALGLRLRRAHPDWFDAAGSYDPLPGAGPAREHVVACLRAGRVACVVTRFALRLAADGGWRGTSVALPAGTWTDLLTGRDHVVAGGGAQVQQLLDDWPVALLVRDGG